MWPGSAGARGVAAIGAVFFAIATSHSAHLALLAALALSIGVCAAFLTWMRRVTYDKLTSPAEI
jgi:flagellar biosynthesis/type III secretory pathway M-ring protein FliF/YscJ